jgi:transcriptional regulator with XRE-family HTH domain
MDPSQNRRGRSSPLDFDRLIGTKSEARQAADGAEIVASVGELVRRVRGDVTQSDLARRTAITQAHISELERGLGTNGPTVVTLARIVSELGDKALIDTAKERAAREADQINEAASWVSALLHEAIQEPVASGASRVQAFANAMKGATESDEAETNPFKRVFAQGILVGIRLAQHITDVMMGLQEGRKVADLFDKMILDWEKGNRERQRDPSFRSENG